MDTKDKLSLISQSFHSLRARWRWPRVDVRDNEVGWLTWDQPLQFLNDRLKGLHLAGNKQSIGEGFHLRH